MSRPVLVIGGGISGLSTAWWLAQRKIPVEVWEKDPRIGGKICTNNKLGYITEASASLLVNFLPEIDHCITAAGLIESKRLRRRDLRRYTVHRGQLTEVPMSLIKLLFSPLWSRSARVRLLTEILSPRSHRPHESVSQFICRRFGPEFLETAIEPFVAGTLASDPDYADARSLLPRLTRLEQQYGSVTAGVLAHRIIKRRRINRSEAFSFRQGMGELVQALSRHPLIRIKTGQALKGIDFQDGKWHAHAESGACRHVRHLVISTPAQQAASLLRPLDPDLSGLLEGIRYAPLSVLHLGFDRTQIGHPLDGGGFLTARRERQSLNGNLWMSSLFPERAPPGKALLTSYVGGARHPECFHWDDDRLINSVTSELKSLIDLRGAPEFIHIDRHPQALPLYYGDYQQRLSAITGQLAGWPGLHLVGNYRGGVSVRERIYCGMQNARKISQDRRLQSSDPHKYHGRIIPLTTANG